MISFHHIVNLPSGFDLLPVVKFTLLPGSKVQEIPCRLMWLSVIPEQVKGVLDVRYLFRIKTGLIIITGRIGSAEISCGRLQWPVYGVSLSSLFSYSEQDWRLRCQFYPSQTQCTATAPAVHCNRSCSALHPPLQCTAWKMRFLFEMVSCSACAPLP